MRLNVWACVENGHNMNGLISVGCGEREGEERSSEREREKQIERTRGKVSEIETKRGRWLKQ